MSAGPLGRLLHKTPHQWVLLASSLGARLKAACYYRLLFRAFGKGSLLYGPVILSYPQNISVGRNTTIRGGGRLEALPVRSGRPPQLSIGNSVNIEQNVHIVCHNRVVIGDKVSITANCAIVDTTHPFDDVAADLKVGDLVADDDGYVEIGEGTFIGIGCVVLPFVRIGKGCVIGANSVVTRDIPDYSVAAGSPAVVLRAIRRIER